MVLSNSITPQDESIIDSRGRININSYAETLICQKCGKEYISRGKNDPGFCKECYEEMNFIDGPLKI